MHKGHILYGHNVPVFTVQRTNPIWVQCMHRGPILWDAACTHTYVQSQVRALCHVLRAMYKYKEPILWGHSGPILWDTAYLHILIYIYVRAL